jgi:uncharacterized protein YjbI with pentapeptide repeats
VNLLDKLIPAIREVRTPLIAGYAWLFALWLCVAGSVPRSVNEATDDEGSLADVVARLWTGLSSASRLVIASVVAYLIGSLIGAVIDTIRPPLDDRVLVEKARELVAESRLRIQLALPLFLIVVLAAVRGSNWWILALIVPYALLAHGIWLRNRADPLRPRPDLAGRDLVRAYLRGANLQGANLSKGILQQANLRGADLRYADLWHTDLNGANLRGANLRGADLRGAYLRWADMREAILERADLRGANLSGTKLELADLRGADLSDADVRYANLRRVNHVSHVDSDEPLGTFTTGEDRVKLHGADLSGADLTGAWLFEEDLQGVVSNEETRWPGDD